MSGKIFDIPGILEDFKAIKDKPLENAGKFAAKRPVTSALAFVALPLEAVLPGFLSLGIPTAAGIYGAKKFADETDEPKENKFTPQSGLKK
tara:strand:+ start:406 stop:678 length:273 start_codon:yes stop_codon:yes gene_type:complete